MPKKHTPAYQSPIALDKCSDIAISEYIDLYGRNENAIFNPITKNYEVKSRVIISINHRKYKLHEYHFHIESEHKVNGEKYPAEIHYVFIEHNDKCEDVEQRYDVCGCNHPTHKNILVIGRTIDNTTRHKNLENLQVKIPGCYYQYDGTLTTGDYSPVRWLVGEKPIHYDMKQLIPISKSARPLQPLDGRIILLCNRE